MKGNGTETPTELEWFPVLVQLQSSSGGGTNTLAALIAREPGDIAQMSPRIYNGSCCC